MQVTTVNTVGATEALGAADDLLEVGESYGRFIDMIIAYKSAIPTKAEAPVSGAY